MSELTEELLADARERMGKSVESIRHEFGSVRTGRASPALLDRISVDYYGASTPLKQLATISAPEARLLTIQPYDKSSIKAIERAILESDVGLTPNNDGNVIRLSVPELTEERRKQLVKVVRGHRRGGPRRDPQHPPRRDARPARAQGRGRRGSDEEHRAEVELQKLTDGRIAELDELLEPQGSRHPGSLRCRARADSPARYVAIITDGNGRWAQSAACRSSPGTRRARTRSRRASATRRGSGSRS